MLQELQNFYTALQNKREEILSSDIEAEVAARIALQTERIREQVKQERETKATVLAIKMEAITDAIKIISQNSVADSRTEEVSAPLAETADA